MIFSYEGTILYEHFHGVTIQASCENDDKNAKGCAYNSVELYSQETLVKRASYCCSWVTFCTYMLFTDSSHILIQNTVNWLWCLQILLKNYLRLLSSRWRVVK